MAGMPENRYLGWLWKVLVDSNRFGKWFQDYLFGVAWTLAFVVLLLNIGLSYVNFQTIAQTNQAVILQYEKIVSLQHLSTLLSDAETGQRGYILTGEKSYLEPYERATDQIYQGLSRMVFLFRDRPEQAQRLQELKELVRSKLSELAQTIKTRSQSGYEAAQVIVRAGKGEEYMVEFRERIAVMEKSARDLLNQKAEEAQIGRRRAFMILLTGSIVLVGMLIAASVLGRQQFQYRRSVERRLRQSNEELEKRVEHRTEAIRASNESLRYEIIERKRMEEQANLFSAELQRSNKELEQFAAVASHDLQEPLRKIHAFCDRLHSRYSSQLDKAGQEYLGRIQTSADRMRRLIDDLLAYARLSTKDAQVAPIDLNKTLAEVMSDLEERVRQTSGKVEYSALPTIEADGLQMRQLFLNLIGNALKFQRRGVAPEIHIQSRILPANGMPARCEIVLSDNGIGFENEYAERIFQMYQRLHGRTEYEGTGMGLALCRKIVERHAGTISAQGTPGQGAVFTIVLPLQQRRDQESPAL